MSDFAVGGDVKPAKAEPEHRPARNTDRERGNGMLYLVTLIILLVALALISRVWDTSPKLAVRPVPVEAKARRRRR